MTDAWKEGVSATVRKLWPEIEQYEGHIHYVYASTNEECAILYRRIDEIVDEIREAFRNGKRKVIFFNNPETVIDVLVYKFQRVVEMLPEIDASNFFFTTASPYGQEAYDRMFESHGWTRRVTVLAGDHFESVVHDMMWPILAHEKPYPVKLKEKKFLCFNKVHRVHRAKLMADMLELDLVKDSFYSFEGAAPAWLDSYVSANEKYRFGKWFDILEAHKDVFPLRLNITPNRTNPIDLLPDDIRYHDESYFSVITETVFYKDSKVGMTLSNHADTLFISEKTYKAMGFKHPFIVMGYPGTLAYLKRTGYKTFHPYIDETYDSVYVDDIRYEMIVKEIQRLCTLTDEQWIEWQKNVAEIVEHNYNLLATRTVFHQTEDIDKLFK